MMRLSPTTLLSDQPVNIISRHDAPFCCKATTIANLGLVVVCLLHEISQLTWKIGPETSKDLLWLLRSSFSDQGDWVELRSDTIRYHILTSASTSCTGTSFLKDPRGPSHSESIVYSSCTLFSLCKRSRALSHRGLLHLRNRLLQNKVSITLRLFNAATNNNITVARRSGSSQLLKAVRWTLN